MKLRNKKTGDIYELNELCLYDDKGFGIRPFLKSLAELNEEWEDYEEPKGIKSIGTIGSSVHIEMGSKEEAEKAVEKLKAWKRLKDKGFRFCGVTETSLDMDCVRFEIGKVSYEEQLTRDSELNKDLLLLFGGEE